MIIFKHSDQLAEHLAKARQKQQQIGFVPTMGALHKGHITLLETAREQADITVCSIFVNPTQFNDPRDYQHYPITLEADIYQLTEAGTDILFLPAVAAMYPNGTGQLEKYELGYLETILEGKYRPGHFQGVCQVMQRLLMMVQPHRLFMGQKDYQQCMVVARLLQLMQSDIQLIPCPTMREADGLAMSSRNRRLPEADRAKAPTIYRALEFLRQQLAPGNLEEIKNNAKALLLQEGFRIDYVETADAHTLALADDWDGHQPLVALIAAFLGDVRLIDNMILQDDNGRS